MGSFSIWYLPLFAFIGYVVWTLFFRDTSSATVQNLSSTSPPKDKDGPYLTKFVWPARDEYEFEVVGESHYQPALAALAGHRQDPKIDGIGMAMLIPEDSNPHDSRAIRVEMGGLTVGYLSREDARKFRKRLSAQQLTGCITSCGAMITGGYKTSTGQQMHYGVNLDLKPFQQK